jgi:hypothetical protein
MGNELASTSTRFARIVWAVAAATLGCAGSSAAPGAGGQAPPDGGSVLSGTYAFPVSYSVLDTSLVKDQCGYQTVLDGGAFAAFALWLSDVDIFNDAGGMLAATPSPSRIVSLQVAGPSYIGSATPPAGTTPQPITPGVYPIGFEDADDDELCSLPPGGAATLDVYDFDGDAGAYTQATALSGTVTVTYAGAGRVAGRFSVELGAIVYGSVFIDTLHPAAFSGTFDSTSGM